jgi:hypothetical protein
MPQLNGTGPDGKGSKTGRKLGKCSTDTDNEKLKKLGKGIGRKRRSGGGKGKGKRLKSGFI